MSRIAKNPIKLPEGVEVSIWENIIQLKGSKGTLSAKINPDVNLKISNDSIQVCYDKSNRNLNAMAGTTRAIISNMVTGVSVGYEKKLMMVGVGYRAQAKGEILSLSLGYSHPIEFPVPEGISIETPTQTEILIKGCDKQKVGQVAANVRDYRSPEPYKGKGVRYSDEEIIRKEAKKK